MTTDLNLVSVFIAVAETCSFRAAADRLGVTRSSVSQAIHKLENQLGALLVQRTTRSVSLTEAGRHLFDRIAPAMAEVGSALNDTADHESRPSGLIRLAVSSIAESFIDGPLLSTFVNKHSGIFIDVTITDERFDIVDRGFDAGVRLGEVLEQDMIAVAVSGDQRQMVVGAPAYVERFGAPISPADLLHHRCIGWRPSPEVVPYRWEFTQDNRDFDIAVQPQVTTNDMRLMLRTALAGGGLTFGMEETFREYIARGELVPMLEAFCPSFPGFFLYFPNRRNLAPKLRALIEHVRERRALAAPEFIKTHL